MELNFTELNNDQTASFTSYWDTNPNPTPTQPLIPNKKQYSYDDILSSLNMVVKNGVLQFAPTQSIMKKHPNQQQTQQPIKQENQQPTQLQSQGKNYIINKYFNYYKDTNIVEEPPKPLTREEYKKMMIENHIKRIQEKKRIAQIKPKKLLFNTSNIHISPSPGQQPKDMNKLFASFKR